MRAPGNGTVSQRRSRSVRAAAVSCVAAASLLFLTACAGTPTGTVSFLDGASTLGTATLGGGTATFSTSALTNGTRSLTAGRPRDACRSFIRN